MEEVVVSIPVLVNLLLGARSRRTHLRSRALVSIPVLVNLLLGGRDALAGERGAAPVSIPVLVNLLLGALLEQLDDNADPLSQFLFW